MTSLDRVIRLIHNEQCNFRVSDDIVKDIEDMVVHLVKDLLPKLIKSYPGCHYSVAEVVDAGSYFEQTKIELPNEFDFMLVVEQLSNEDSISLTKGCREGYAHVGVVNQELWDSAEPDDGPERRFEIAMLQFNMFVRETLKLLLSEPIKGRLGEFTMKNITVRGKPYKAFSHVQTLTLMWTKYSPVDNHSNTKVEILYERQTQEEVEICVDLMSCCHSSLSAFNNLLPKMSLKNELLKKNGCHIVLKSCESAQCVENQAECRLISYTKTEQECMKRLHVNWKMVYKVLKWLFHYTDILEIDTYKIKTAVLYCNTKSGADSGINLGEGLIRVLRELRKSAYHNKLPGFFNSSLNVWNISPCYQYLVKYEINFLLKLFNKMQSVPTDNDNTNLQQNINVINLWLQSFCSHAAEIAEIKKSRLTGMDCFNWQGNVFLEIMRDMEPVLKCHRRFAWVPFQMKCCILGDVFKLLTIILVKKISSMWLVLL
ncbi:uncharacterized protein LOC133185212 [Saccostrea echinata]|uniref:uncharacterized protein LOC133185212 n=1 Tax=Saccostrea echinata TaxID=191078 RepID=UPI002A7F27FF|nr:uncharacterized protein LOC133185212 [Saccostrea echinata]